MHTHSHFLCPPSSCRVFAPPPPLIKMPSGWSERLSADRESLSYDIVFDRLSRSPLDKRAIERPICRAVPCFPIPACKTSNEIRPLNAFSRRALLSETAWRTSASQPPDRLTFHRQPVGESTALDGHQHSSNLLRQLEMETRAHT